MTAPDRAADLLKLTRVQRVRRVEATEALDWDREAVLRWLKGLTNNGILRSEKKGREVYYWLAREWGGQAE